LKLLKCCSLIFRKLILRCIIMSYIVREYKREIMCSTEICFRQDCIWLGKWIIKEDIVGKGVVRRKEGFAQYPLPLINFFQFFGGKFQQTCIIPTYTQPYPRTPAHKHNLKIFLATAWVGFWYTPNPTLGPGAYSGGGGGGGWL